MIVKQIKRWNNKKKIKMFLKNKLNLNKVIIKLLEEQGFLNFYSFKEINEDVLEIVETKNKIVISIGTKVALVKLAKEINSTTFEKFLTFLD